MEVSLSRNSDWMLTGQAFELLLRSFAADRDLAGERYELARSKLIELFEARGSESPADHADETLNRAARKILEGERIENITYYLYGVARLLLLELGRAREKRPLSLDEIEAPAAQPADEHEEQRRLERELRYECFESCLNKLTPDNRTFIVAYYKEEKGTKIKKRKRQAEDLGVSLNALRLRAARVRSALMRCLAECLKGAMEK